MIPRELAVWLVCKFDTCSCSMPFTHLRMMVNKHDVHMTLGLPKGPFKVIEAKTKSNVSIEFASLLKHCKKLWDEYDSSLNVGSGYLEDTLDNTTVIDEKQEVNEEERHNKVLDLRPKSKIKHDFQRSSQLLAEVMTELEELLFGTRVPLKKVRKVVMDLMSDAPIREAKEVEE
ncbi:hypothetical protein Cgig2_012315 [Carnegiea gigantea]|uniref:Uncharacterized protein n=1 Tax=Carnegiea gigantea TaxID=171969 RepID=A0A9Q1GK27_9CARY|nr:hypothetical protein Cgig2_012315 [Carnegiea gigantea]